MLSIALIVIQRLNIYDKSNIRYKFLDKNTSINKGLLFVQI